MIRAARIACGMTQEAAAALLGKTQPTYSKIERGQVDLSARDASKLCAAFGVTLETLISEE